MAKFTVVLAVQYDVEAGSPIKAYEEVVKKFGNLNAKCREELMVTRFDGISVIRTSPVEIV